jgi:hypothetical protein
MGSGVYRQQRTSSGNAPHVEAEEDMDIDSMQLDLEQLSGEVQNHTDGAPSAGDTAPTLGLGVELDVEPEPDPLRSGATGGCKWHVGATLLFAAEAVLLALSLVVHPVHDCQRQDGVLA